VIVPAGPVLRWRWSGVTALFLASMTSPCKKRRRQRRHQCLHLQQGLCPRILAAAHPHCQRRICRLHHCQSHFQKASSSGLSSVVRVHCTNVVPSLPCRGASGSSSGCSGSSSSCSPCPERAHHCSSSGSGECGRMPVLPTPCAAMSWLSPHAGHPPASPCTQSAAIWWLRPAGPYSLRRQ
jgi:hypothetical protein